MNGFEPVSEPTEKQRKFFADTAYANDELQLRRTILARIATLDTSVSDPTDEQLEETAEMLEMVMEVGAPQNEWEQQAVQRLHDVVAKSLESTRANGTARQPEPPEDEASAQADVGGGETDEEKWKDGDVRYVEKDGSYYRQTYRQGESAASSGWSGEVINKDEWDTAQKAMEGGMSAGDVAKTWDEGAGQRKADRDADAKIREAALEQTNRVNSLVAHGALGHAAGRTLLGSAAKAVSGGDSSAISDLGGKLDVVEQRAKDLERVKAMGVDMSSSPFELGREDINDMVKGAVNAIVNAPVYVAEGIVQAGAAVAGAAVGAVKGAVDGTGVASGALGGIGTATGAVHEAANNLRKSVNFEYQGMRREMGDLPVGAGLPSLNQIESGTLTTIGGLATPGMLMKGAGKVSAVAKPATQVVQAAKPAVQQATKAAKPAAQAARQAAQVTKPAAQMTKSSASKSQFIKAMPTKPAVKPVASMSQPIKAVPAAKPAQVAAKSNSLVPKAVFGEARAGKELFGEKSWEALQQMAKERGITLPTSFKPAVGGKTIQERVASVWADSSRFNFSSPGNRAYSGSFGYVGNPRTGTMVPRSGFQFRGTARDPSGSFLTMTKEGIGIHFTPNELTGRAAPLGRAAEHLGMFGENGEFYSIW